MKTLGLVLLCVLSFGFSKPRTSVKAYVLQWNTAAVAQMKAHKIPASITLAQGILESGNGNSKLTQNANNHFGIKCYSWKGEQYNLKDGRCFRKYKDGAQSFADHAKFLKGKRYQRLYKLKLTDYKGWAKGLKACGYATNPNYPNLLINLIEKYKLHKYDRV